MDGKVGQYYLVLLVYHTDIKFLFPYLQ